YLNRTAKNVVVHSQRSLLPHASDRCLSQSQILQYCRPLSMGRAQFEYDEVGNTFYYVLVSFYALILVPATFFFWPSSKKDGGERKEHCGCEGCMEKHRKAEASRPWRRTKKALTFAALLLAWVIFLFIVHKVTQIEQDHTEYDPYAILGLDQGAAVSQVKKRYRELSKTMHPDKGGDPVQFDRIAKAYQALTDEESRENWEKYGNPDGPTATTFGIALPKWIVSKEYGVWVLAFYGFVLMILLPSAVGFWWYNSIKYSVDQVLIDTAQMYYYFFHKTPKMEINRMIMVLGGSFEFWKQYNKEIIERESDDIELPPLIKEFRNLSENKKERPLCLPYSLKARLFIHAHLNRYELPSDNLKNDSNYVLSKCVMLVNEMLSVTQQLYFYGNPSRCPSLDTIENLVKLVPMIVQALWPKNSPILQLPHITEHNLHHFRRNRIVTCADLANVGEAKRRHILQSLNEPEYRDVIFVLQSMPKLTIETRFEVQGEDDCQEVTVGSVVTLKVKLIRSRLLDPDKRMEEIREINEKGTDVGDVEEEEENEEKENAPKRKVWEKQPKKKPNKSRTSKNRQPQKVKGLKKNTPKAEEEDTKKEEDLSRKEKKETDEGAQPSAADSDDDDVSGSEKDDNHKSVERNESEEESGSNYEGGNVSDDSDGEDWANENLVKKQSLLERKSNKTHPVHCPYYAGEKFEWWWLFLIDKKLRRLVVPGVHCTTLVDEQTVEIKFGAPQQKGIYYYNLLVKSDSYMDCDYSLDLKLEVQEAKEVPPVKYEDSEEEQVEDSSDYTEDSESDHD
uniref:J domain-containing protein n=1 Tax=Parascaris univalens TaxID=6257 RepID=A0A915ACS8_PARUN